MKFSNTLLSSALLFAAFSSASKESCENLKTAQLQRCGGLQDTYSCVCSLSSEQYWDYYYDCVINGGASVTVAYLDNLKVQICGGSY
ncbi:uncharacterized protein ASCRUDRAFT_77625 [Ascoidea rubescens DSM 1968]|uniref:Extracellular membrane protein CFEM domain-containing protein n=1 Tax=Ascoidea rubescens DSM 1968 TaxID=1344418 RepID=A0A1D2VBC4_9ASCO|nr:hypothetical protein ASCRUDRAFT_77625 [Ascoidea rubescens DSM 1968]ODV58909.1 hypothetical protein ASCRUDRAFT_77625 [Ascoidea rubescens DSM 1968]